jgi:AAA+ ATPase superfamily predicted ATPase
MEKFYNREQQLSDLRAISAGIEQSKGQLSVVVGRRRVGKTRLLNEAFAQERGLFLYLFISRKNEAALVEEFTNILRLQLGVKFFQPQSLLDIFEFLFDYAQTEPLTLVVDEFQDIERLNPGLFSSLQNLWDQNKRKSMMHWVCCGSLYSLMTQLFKGAKQPLLNRDDHFFKIQPLAPQYLQQMLLDNQLFTPERLLQWWCLSGGIPKYLEWLLNAGEQPFEKLITTSSPLIEEGLHRLVEDFGSEHRAYFSVLAAIAKGYTSRARIENYLDMGVGPVLEKLENEFDIITRQRPIHAKENSRNLRYSLIDPFLVFWFHFIHANRSAVEMENFSYLRKLIARDFDTFSGKQLESLFTAQLKYSRQFNRIGGYWDNKGEQEIDIVAINDLEKRLLVVEVKRQSKRFKAEQLASKTQQLLQKLNCQGYSIEQRCFALDNLEQVFAEFTDVVALRGSSLRER